MPDLYASIAAIAAEQHGAVSIDDLRRAGVARSTRASWLRRGRIVKIGTRTYRLAGAPVTWQQRLWAAVTDLGPSAYAAGRSAAALHQLDGFEPGSIEVLVTRAHRNRAHAGTMVTTGRPIGPGDVCRIDGIPCLRAERLILETPLFGFRAVEMDDAIDHGVRRRLVAANRLRARVAADLSRGINHGRRLRVAVGEAGGESGLERAFLRIVHAAGLPRPRLQVTYRDGTRVIARVDAAFGDDLVVELDGHGTHASRRQRQRDAQRRTELTLHGKRLIVFTLEDVRERPAWLVARLGDAVGSAAMPMAG